MKPHEPNFDMLSSYQDGMLSPDAARSMEQHLEQCDVCALALASERGLIRALDSLAAVSPPPDFVNAVMGRVAQHPAHSPAASLPWRAAMRLSVAASLLLAVLLGGGAAWLVGSGVLESAEPGNLLAAGISRVTVGVTSAYSGVRGLVAPAMVLVEGMGKFVWRLSALAAASGWAVQLTLLLLTISLNYAFTRLVLGYQRRH